MSTVGESPAPPILEPSVLRWLAPTYRFEVADHDVSANMSRFVTAVEYETAIGMADRVSITLLNPDHMFTDSRVLSEGNTIKLWLGYAGGPGAELTVFCGAFDLAPPPAVFPRDGIPTIKLIGYDPITRWMINVRHKGTNYHNCSDSYIVHHLAEQHYDCNVYEPVPLNVAVKKTPHKVGETDFDLLNKVTERNGREWWMRTYTEDDELPTLNWVDIKCFGDDPDGDGPGVLKYRYLSGDKGTLLSFAPDPSLQGQRSKITMSYWNNTSSPPEYRTVEVDINKPVENPKWTARSAASTVPEVSAPSAGASVQFTLFGEVVEGLAGRTFTTDEEAQAFASAFMMRRLNEYIIGNGVVVGDPRLRARQVHDLLGLGQRYSGRYRFTRVKHRWTPGALAQTDFTAFKVPGQEAVSDEDSGLLLARRRIEQQAALNVAAGELFAEEELG